jgi:hypothetical protein
MPLFTGDPASGPYQYSLVLSKDVLESSSADDTIVSLTPALPDPRFATTVYFSVTLDKLGPYVQDNTARYNPVKWSDWECWWPASYRRIRALYGIYGEFAYLWSKSESDHWEYDWENRT